MLIFLDLFKPLSIIPPTHLSLQRFHFVVIYRFLFVGNQELQTNPYSSYVDEWTKTADPS